MGRKSKKSEKAYTTLELKDKPFSSVTGHKNEESSLEISSSSCIDNSVKSTKKKGKHKKSEKRKFKEDQDISKMDSKKKRKMAEKTNTKLALEDSPITSV